jgi:hypothetical protein
MGGDAVESQVSHGVMMRDKGMYGSIGRCVRLLQY